MNRILEKPFAFVEREERDGGCDEEKEGGYSLTNLVVPSGLPTFMTVCSCDSRKAVPAGRICLVSFLFSNSLLPKTLE